MPEPPPVSEISELVLEVSDIEAARRFYRDVLGFEETLYGEGREGRYWYLVGETARLGLWTPQTGLAGGRGGVHVHFAFHVADEAIDRLRERITAAGADVEGPIQLGPGRFAACSNSRSARDMTAYTQEARGGGEPGTFRSAD